MINKKWLIPVTGFTALLILFFYSTLGTVPGGDSGMFIGAAYSGGVAQPPGYPLITLFYKIIFLLPFDDIFLINFSSALFNLGASLFLYLTFIKIIGCRLTAIVLACFFCVLPVVFRYSLVAEVFALNNFLCSAIIYLSFSYQLSERKLYLYLGALFLGLGISNHHSFVLLSLPITIWLIFKFKNKIAYLTYLKLFPFFLLGLSPYVYLFFPPGNSGEITWGETESLNGFLHHFLRKDFGTFKLTSSGSGGLTQNLIHFFSDLPLESFGLLIIFPLLWLVLKRKNITKNRFENLIFITFIFYLIFFFSLSNIDLTNPLFKEVFTRFWQLPLLLLLILCAYGISVFNELYPSKRKILFSLLLITLLGRGALSFSQSSRKDNDIIEDYGRTMLNSLPKKAVLFATGDLQVNILRYLQVVKKLRTDVTILPIPLMDLPWYRKVHRKKKTDLELPPGLYSTSQKPNTYQLLDIIQLNPQKSFFILQEASLVKKMRGSDKSTQEQYKWIPYGFLFSLVPKRNNIPIQDVFKDHSWSLGGFLPSKYRRMEKGSWEELVYDTVYWNAERFHMIYHTRALKSDPNPSHKIMLANHIYKLYQVHKVIPPEFLKNLGLLYYQLIGRLPSARQKLVKIWGEYYKRHNDKNSNEAKEIKRAIDHFARKK